MRTGREYREALHDGRRVFVVGEGLIEDVTLHPATRPMVDEYALWYDRHHDAAWQERLLAPPEGGGARGPWAFAVPRTPDDLRAMGRAYAATLFLTAGNVTHTPAYGNLIALGIHDVVRQRDVSPQQAAAAAAYRDEIARTGRFLTFSAALTAVVLPSKVTIIKSEFLKCSTKIVRMDLSGCTRLEHIDDDFAVGPPSRR